MSVPDFRWFADRLDVARWESQDAGRESAFFACPVHGGSDSLHVTSKNGKALAHCFGCGADAVTVAGALDGAAEAPRSAVRVASGRRAPTRRSASSGDALARLADHCGVDRSVVEGLPVEDGGDGEPVFAWPDGSRKRRHWDGKAKATWDADRKHHAVWPIEDEMPEEAWFTEGEPDAIVLRSRGVVAYSLGAAGEAPTTADWESMRGRGLRRAVIAGDMDGPGRLASAARLTTAVEAGIAVAVAEVPGYDPLTGACKDWRDWHLAGGEHLPSVARPASAVRSMAEFVADHAGDVYDPVLEGLAYRGIVSMLAGPMKGGKTTLLRHAVECLRDGEPFLGRWEARPDVPVLYLTEEGAVTVRQNLGHLDMDVVSRRDREPSRWELAETIAVAADWLADHPGGLVVADTYDKWAGVENENDTAENVAAIAAFYSLAEAGAAVLLVHHSRKGGGDYGEGIRGSSAILGAVDHAVELKYVSPGSDRRWFEVHGRVLENARRLLDFDRDTGRYFLVDEAAERDAELDGWLDAFPSPADDPDGVTQRDAEAHWGIRAGAKRIERLIAAGLVTRSGSLVKDGRGKAWRYWRSDPVVFIHRRTDQPPANREAGSSVASEAGVTGDGTPVPTHEGPTNRPTIPKGVRRSKSRESHADEAQRRPSNRPTEGAA